MSVGAERPKGLRVDMTIPVWGLVLLAASLMVQTGTGIWWASAMTQRVDNVEHRLDQVAQDHALLIKIDERTDWMKTGLQQLTGDRLAAQDGRK